MQFAEPRAQQCEARARTALPSQGRIVSFTLAGERGPFLRGDKLSRIHGLVITRPAVIVPIAGRERDFVRGGV